MTEPDDRLAGDEVWELYPTRATESALRARLRRAVGLMPVVGVGLVVWPPLAVLLGCLALGWDDFRQAFQTGRWVTDPKAAIVARRFNLGWGFFKVGGAGAALMFGIIWLAVWLEGKGPVTPPPAFAAAALTFFGGFLLSAWFTATGLYGALRGEMRVWIGQGINQARMLLLGMLIVGFLFTFLIPLCILMVPMAGANREGTGMLLAILFAGGMLIGPIVLLLLLDWLSARVLAATPARFGAKVAAVGKWAPAPTAVGVTVSGEHGP